MLGAEAAGAVVGLLAGAAAVGVLFAGLLAATVGAWCDRDMGSQASRTPECDPDRTLDETALPADPRDTEE